MKGIAKPTTSLQSLYNMLTKLIFHFNLACDMLSYMFSLDIPSTIQTLFVEWKKSPKSAQPSCSILNLSFTNVSRLSSEHLDDFVSDPWSFNCSTVVANTLWLTPSQHLVRISHYCKFGTVFPSFGSDWVPFIGRTKICFSEPNDCRSEPILIYEILNY